MTYQVLARKWRPKDFASLVGQEHVVRALTHALDGGRLHHAYLFTGTRGVGKTTLSRIFAKALNCETGVTSTPCGVCRACREIDEGRFVDYVEMDAASNRGVDEMAALLERAVYAPVDARFKVYMIDEVHMLTNHAFNAMLKTLEEPPSHVKFILATTDPQKIPVTVLSRCLQFNLKQMPAGHIVSHLEHILGEEHVPFEAQALRLLARAADGSMRDALSLTDQAIAYSANQVTDEAVRGMLGALDQSYLIRLLDALADGDGAAVLAVADEMSLRSLSFSTALQDLASLLHRIGWAQFAPSSVLDEWPEATDVRRFAETLSAEQVQLFYQIATIGRSELGLAPDEYAGFTMTLLRMLAFEPAPTGGGGGGAATTARPGGVSAAGGAKRSGAPVAASKAVDAGIDAVSRRGVPETAVDAVARPGGSEAAVVALARHGGSQAASMTVAMSDAAGVNGHEPGVARDAEPVVMSAAPVDAAASSSAAAAPSGHAGQAGAAERASAQMDAAVQSVGRQDSDLKAIPAAHSGADEFADQLQPTNEPIPGATGAMVASAAEQVAPLRDADAKDPAVVPVPAESTPVRATPSRDPATAAATSVAPAARGISAEPAAPSEAAAAHSAASVVDTVPRRAGGASAALDVLRSAGLKVSSDRGRATSAAAPAVVPKPAPAVLPKAVAPRVNVPVPTSGAPRRAEPAAPVRGSSPTPRSGGQGGSSVPPWDDMPPDDYVPLSAEDDYFGPVDDGYMPVFDVGPDDVRVPLAAPAPAVSVDTRPLPPAVPLDIIGFNGDWPTFAVGLALKGISYQLAFNSELMALEGNTLKLNVPVPQYAEASQVAKLKIALAERLGKEVEVLVEVGPARRTAAAFDAAVRAQRQKDAEREIGTDPFVQSLIREFGASIVPGSIRPITTDAAGSAPSTH